MKTKTLQVILITAIVIMLSCSSSSPKADDPQHVPETPKALKDDNSLLSDVKSAYSRSSNLVDKLYDELADKIPALKKIEDDISALGPKSNEAIEKFASYNGKSESYYGSAGNYAATISDSVLRKQIEEVIQASNKAYKNKTAHLGALLDQMAKQSTNLNDHHTMLKILVTLPLIEEYQKNSQPSDKDFQAVLKTQQQIINQINSASTKK